MPPNRRRRRQDRGLHGYRGDAGAHLDVVVPRAASVVAGTTVLGAIVTAWLPPEPKRKSVEMISDHSVVVFATAAKDADVSVESVGQRLCYSSFRARRRHSSAICCSRANSNPKVKPFSPTVVPAASPMRVNAADATTVS
jgi:hypothetical protein